jgi:hypothetical protein
LREQTIVLNRLESHLWESANILRGPVDAADFKTYIFPLLFFKRICDVWDEEYDEIVDESGDAELALFPESHRFQIPDDCHWSDVRAVATNVGNALQRAMREIEKANPDTLYGVFGDAQWTNKDRLSDALLKDLVEHFSCISFGNKNIASDVLGDAYEYLGKAPNIGGACYDFIVAKYLFRKNSVAICCKAAKQRRIKSYLRRALRCPLVTCGPRHVDARRQTLTDLWPPPAGGARGRGRRSPCAADREGPAYRH